MDSLIQDVRYGVRMLRKSPGFTAIAVLTLALGIGASTAVFSVVDTVLLRPLPYDHPGQLVTVTETLPEMGSDELGVSAGEYQDYRDRNRSFSEVASYETDGFNLTGADHVVILSQRLWQHSYSGDPDILGKSVKLNEQPYTVIGVMPDSFRFPFDGAPQSEMADLWVPFVFPANLLAPQNRTQEFGVGFIGRLKSGVTLAQAQDDVSGIANAFMQEYEYPGTIRVVPKAYAFSRYTTEKARPLLWLLALDRKS